MVFLKSVGESGSSSETEISADNDKNGGAALEEKLPGHWPEIFFLRFCGNEIYIWFFCRVWFFYVFNHISWIVNVWWQHFQQVVRGVAAKSFFYGQLQVVVKDVHNKFYAAVGFVDFEAVENREKQHGQVVVHVLGVIFYGSNGITHAIILLFADRDPENGAVNFFIFSQREPVEMLRHKPRKQQRIVLKAPEGKHFRELGVKGHWGVVVFDFSQFSHYWAEFCGCLWYYKIQILQDNVSPRKINHKIDTKIIVTFLSCFSNKNMIEKGKLIVILTKKNKMI